MFYYGKKKNQKIQNQAGSVSSSLWNSSRAAPCQAHLKDLLIQYPGAEHDDAVDVDDGVLAPVQELGDFLFTVQNQGDIFLLHTQSHSVPPVRTQPTDVSGTALGFAGQGNDCTKNELSGIDALMEILPGQSLKGWLAGEMLIDSFHPSKSGRRGPALVSARSRDKTTLLCPFSTLFLSPAQASAWILQDKLIFF